MRAAFYLRVSTDRQTTDNQLPDLERLARERNYDVIRISRENETAWKKGHQHELADLRRAAARREFDVLMVWDLDRLTREGIAAIIGIIQEFDSYGVKVVSYNQSWVEQVNDITRPLLIALHGWVAKYDSDQKRGRINAGIARARAEGKHIGRPKGRKDGPGVKRKKSGYYARQEREREMNK